jgi:hypothetical protein
MGLLEMTVKTAWLYIHTSNYSPPGSTMCEYRYTVHSTIDVLLVKAK